MGINAMSDDAFMLLMLAAIVACMVVGTIAEYLWKKVKTLWE